MRFLFLQFLVALAAKGLAQVPCDSITIYYVAPFGSDSSATASFTEPLQTIQEAVDRACDQDSILILPGTFVENIAIHNKDLRVGGLELLTGEVVSSSMPILDGGDVATTLYVLNSQVHLSGLIIQNGRSGAGAGLFLNNCSHSIVNRCTIRNNTGIGDITAHGINLSGNNCTISNCHLYGNYGRKRLINLSGTNHLVTHCTIENNNTWEEGTVVVNSFETRVENCLIRNNSGGGITIYRNDTQVQHCSVVNNTPRGLSVNAGTSGAQVSIFNSILYGNGGANGDNIRISQTGSAVWKVRLHHCILEEGGNYPWLSVYKIIELDSTVVDVAPQLDDDAMPLPTSPALGAGALWVDWDGIPLYSSTTDLTGNPRPFPVGSMPDLGCLENEMGMPASILGCTDALACNFNPLADMDDNSCELPGCTDSTACNYDPTTNCSGGICLFPGCLDPLACNFDESAACEGGICYFDETGCTDAYACNYDADATCDNGSCDYTCCPGPGCCSNGMAWDSTWSQCVLTCPTDLDFDGSTRVSDILIMLSAFDTVCNPF